MMTRQQRRELILELVSRNQIESQEQLQELLLVEGVQTTQATISRDLRG
jgi:transcriptional regulator of arginine metabolism